MTNSFSKNGLIKSPNLYESSAMNLFEGVTYTKDNPFVVSGTGKDMYRTTCNYCKVTPGKTYYYCAKSDKTWAASHGTTANTATMWLYLFKTYNPSMGLDNYDTPINFTSKNMFADGIWKYTIPSDYNMVSVRVNTYSNGTDIVVAKFWDFALIPEEYYVSSTPPQKFVYAYWNRFYFNRRTYGNINHRKVVV